MREIDISKNRKTSSVIVSSQKKGCGICFRENDVSTEKNETESELQMKDNDLIIWIEDIESARILQEQMNIICLHLNGYRVLDLSK